MPLATVIIAFYNKIDYLKLVLAGLERQSCLDFEVIIADDGSSEAVVTELKSFIKNMPFPVLHLWQEDKNFRKNRILNRAVITAQTNYLIFMDGDCVPHYAFVKEHIKNRQLEVCLTGRRVNLSEKVTRMLTYEKVKRGLLEDKIHLLTVDGLFGKSKDVEKGFYFKSSLLRNLLNRKKRGLLGCNFSLHKADLLAINGFDERYEAPAIGEDTDVQFRLELRDMKIASLNHVAVQYHLYHQQLERPEQNLRLYEEVQHERTAFTPYGIHQLTS